MGAHRPRASHPARVGLVAGPRPHAQPERPNAGAVGACGVAVGWVSASGTQLAACYWEYASRAEGVCAAQALAGHMKRHSNHRERITKITQKEVA